MATFIQNNQKVGRQYNIEGDFHQKNSNNSINISGGNVGVANTGDNANIQIDTQNIGNLDVNDSSKSELEELVAQLTTELQNLSKTQQKQAQEISELTESLLEEAAKDKPKQSLLKVTSTGLLEAAKAIMGVLPTAAKIVPKIVKLIVGS
ncbi:hypothetical protein [Candidatus Venteria ishoeyi]|uniref:Uncharacterized protein n=1 Tax=Candidatus Venteria ishoeyi TaxID=1899563 RepID=A0A1H6FAX0_9GAMM|nr:hypothetical protein [Candidatus Venteria ishoeyi]MDM8547211.1 hypothetical protein [Candidatus Venteria ishoeyi]SEH06521.1 Uncharacterised protein [Candidatus Venteria ishoeyi]